MAKGRGAQSLQFVSPSLLAMASSQILILVLVCSLVITEAVPRLRPAKKAMRNSLVRFGKRSEYDAVPQAILGEQFDPVGDSGERYYYPEARNPIIFY